ncbi:hypothetical protein BC936DRAFT_148148 [Jimgerdemannia flammicorona]|uniref:Mediator of RNA polymerase II transcription subunit 16 n=1 Tax=Jimgerdemannia flammicorona TaxID=994334 RepID=A0A433DKR7_9FUNG|nr:hypothetical protein BC936DRAFT_148148 [Jimgerdemannia flammicorona]
MILLIIDSVLGICVRGTKTTAQATTCRSVILMTLLMAKRRRDDHAPYNPNPLAVIHSNLRFRAANTYVSLFLTLPSWTLPLPHSPLSFRSCLAWSSNNVLAYVPPKPTTSVRLHQLSDGKRPKIAETAEHLQNDQSNLKQPFVLATAADPSIDQPLRYVTMITQAQQCHKHHTITHLSWNQRGTCLASVDETGKIALWEMKQAVDDWACVKELDMEQPVVAFLWLNTHRRVRSYPGSHGLPTPSYTFEKYKGPRNPHGHLAFVAVTANGEIAVRYQHEGNIFSEMSTRLQRPPNVQADRCRISHASLVLNDDGHIYLATHWASSTPKLVCMYEIPIKFTSITPQGVIQCRPITRLRLCLPLPNKSLSLVSHASVLHLKLLAHAAKPRLVIVVAEEQDVPHTEQAYVDANSDGYTSALAIWELAETSSQLRNDFSDPDPMQNDTFSTQPKPTMKFVTGHLIPDRLVTALSTTGGGRELVLGFSNGTVNLEYRDSLRHGVSKTQSAHDWTTVVENDCIGYEFWRPVRRDDNITDYGCVVDIAVSPNEASLTYVSSSGDVMGVDITDYEAKPEQDLPDTVLSLPVTSLADNLSQMIVLSLLNNVDYADLITVVKKLSSSLKRPDLAESILEQVIDEYDHIRNPDIGGTDHRTPQFPTLSDISQTYGLMLSMLRYKVQRKSMFGISLPFGPLSRLLHGRLTLPLSCSATCTSISIRIGGRDFLSRYLSNNNASPVAGSKSASVPMIDTIPTAAALIIHNATRECLRRCLILVQQLELSLKVDSAPTTNNLESLKGHIENLLAGLPIPLEMMLTFLKDVAAVVSGVNKDSVDAPSNWSERLLTRGLIPRHLESQLRKVLAKHRSIFESAQLCLSSKGEGPGDTSDVVRKCSNSSIVGSSGTDDPTAKTAWYASFDRTCVCGGFWRKLAVLHLDTIVACTVATLAVAKESFDEELVLKSLADGKLFTHFQFTTRLDYEPSGDALFSHYGLFPKAIGQIIQRYGARELHLTFTQGRWNYEDWGYPIAQSAGTGVELWAWMYRTESIEPNWKALTNALSGLFCASLNFIDETITSRPRMSFRPEGFYNEQADPMHERQDDPSDDSELRYGSLPHESVCTENLTPWIKLLPCKAKAGVSTLLNAHKLYDTNFHSMAIHVRPVCKVSDHFPHSGIATSYLFGFTWSPKTIDCCVVPPFICDHFQDVDCNQKQLELVQTVTSVFDPVRVTARREWSFQSLFDRKIERSCAVASLSRVLVLLPTITEDNAWQIFPSADDSMMYKVGEETRQVAVYDLAKVHVPFDLQMIWQEHIFLFRYGQERGGLTVNIVNQNPNETVPVIYFDSIPWYLKLYLHTLKVSVTWGQDVRQDGRAKWINPVRRRLLWFSFDQANLLPTGCGPLPSLGSRDVAHAPPEFRHDCVD